jgi:hypothetical protein
MSRGPGKIERAIEALFRERSDDAFTVEDIADRIYVGINRTEKRHRVSVLRAAKKVCDRMTDWTWYVGENRGNTLVFLNPCDVRSYAIGRLKADMCHCYRHKDQRVWRASSEQEIKAMIEPGGYHHDAVREGGVWWRHVQLHIAERDGDTSVRVQQIKADQEEANLIADRALRSVASIMGR